MAVNNYLGRGVVVGGGGGAGGLRIIMSRSIVMLAGGML